MKGDMEVEVLKEDMDMEHCSKRMKRIMMSPEEQMMYKCCPEMAKGNTHPGYPVEDESYGDTL